MNVPERVVLIATLLAGQGAHASTDTKTYPGVACQPASKGTPFAFNQTRGGMFNTSALLATDLCPIVRDIKAGADRCINSVKMRVYDRNSGSDKNADTYCTLSSLSVNGGAVASNLRHTNGLES
jgi:hypothetical protein